MYPAGFLRLFVAMVVALLAAPAWADPASSTLAVGYGISFWNIQFGHTDYQGTVTGDSYSVRSHFETSGMVGVFWKSLIDATANGGISSRGVAPVLYDSHARNRDHPLQQIKVTYENDEPTTFADPPYDTVMYPVSAAEKKGAVDPMSAVTAILTAAKADAKNPCGGGAQVFDGRRRYDVVFDYLKDETIKLSNGLYEGNAHLCRIHYNAIAGYPQRLVGDRAPPKMFADLVDVPAPGAPNGHYLVPARVWAELSLGTMMVTLDSIKVDGVVPPAMGAKS